MSESSFSSYHLRQNNERWFFMAGVVAVDHNYICFAKC